MNLLPASLTFPPLNDPRFRPILPLEGESSATVEPIYRLVGGDGVSYGTAMAAIRHRDGDLAACRIYHITPALAHAVDEVGEPALHRILPAVLADALATAPPSVDEALQPETELARP